MKKIFSSVLLAGVMAAPSVYAIENYYLEMDAGVNSDMLDDGGNYGLARVGMGVHLFRCGKTGLYWGMDAHVGTNFTKVDWEDHGDKIGNDPFQYLLADSSGLIGFETDSHVDLALKLGVHYDYINYKSTHHEDSVDDQFDAQSGGFRGVHHENDHERNLILPQIGVAVGIPVVENLKITGELDYRFIAASATVGLRYVF